MTEAESDTERELTTRRVRMAQNRVMAAELELQRAIEAREDVLVKAHGWRSQGKLSYAELARVTGLSKGRVIQIVQPHRPQAPIAQALHRKEQRDRARRKKKESA